MNGRRCMLALALILLVLFAAPVRTTAYAQTYGTYIDSNHRNGVKLWEATDNMGYARWNKVSGNKLSFCPKVPMQRPATL